ncbi:MAG: hypothetical protein A2285_10275 [Elusimicrobia bacterium RIFOXYA12_FULL_57_11]|nr:MAG: hypothetical protein A2285_10275 [Elusimicrobia bacterium RIFOXYA12_FULL_57_11]
MKLPLKFVFAALAAATLCLPACAQEDEYPSETAVQERTTAANTAPARPAVKKTAAKKKPVRKKKAAPVSEYKFQSAEQTPTYKFDKKADPILKPVKKKKPAKTAASGDTGKPIPKLKKVKSIGEEDAPPATGLPPGIPGAGGK